MKRFALLLVAASAACGPVNHDPDPETVSPLLEVTSPARGYVSPTREVAVRGTAADEGSGLKNVFVNDVAATVAGDGTWEVRIELEDGLTHVKTVAVDRWGNETSDVRAVLRGEFVPQHTIVNNAVAARVTDETFSTLAVGAGNFVDGLDLGAAVQPFNPVLEGGVSCFNATVDLREVLKDNTVVDFYPHSGGISFSIELQGFEAELRANFTALCFGGGTTVFATADALRVMGNVDVFIENETVQVEVTSATGTFDGLKMDLSAIPGSIVEGPLNNLDGVIAGIIAGRVASMVPLFMKSSVNMGSDFTVDLFGHPLKVGILPSQVELSSDGLMVTLDTGFQIQGAAMGRGFLATPQPLPAVADPQVIGPPLGLLIADDVVNQVLNAFWSADVFDANLAFDSSQLGLAGEFDSARVDLLLPPIMTARTGGPAVQVGVGDVRIDLLRGGNLVVALAINAEIGLDMEVGSGTFQLRTGAIESWVNVVEIGESSMPPKAIEAVGVLAVDEIARMLGEILGEVPLPGIAGVEVTGLSLESAPLPGGYAVLSASLSAD